MAFGAGAGEEAARFSPAGRAAVGGGSSCLECVHPATHTRRAVAMRRATKTSDLPFMRSTPDSRSTGFGFHRVFSAQPSPSRRPRVELVWVDGQGVDDVDAVVRTAHRPYPPHLLPSHRTPPQPNH